MKIGGLFNKISTIHLKEGFDPTVRTRIEPADDKIGIGTSEIRVCVGAAETAVCNEKVEICRRIRAAAIEKVQIGLVAAVLGVRIEKRERERSGRRSPEKVTGNPAAYLRGNPNTIPSGITVKPI
jgi:hypothetical protein